MARLILFNKPYGVLSQFTDPSGRSTLADYLRTPGVYPAGRLDRDSEGLLVLTDDGRLQHQISHPRRRQAKCYWVQVEGDPGPDAVASLRHGVALKDGRTRPARARLIDPPPLWPRNPPVSRQQTSWLEIVISEGRNRQVRRMTAAVGHPTLRLVRHQIGHWQLEDLMPGQYRETRIHPPATRRGYQPGN